MQRLSAWARWIAAGVFTLCVIPIAVEFVKRVAESIGLYDRPREAAGTILNFFLTLAELAWLRVTALVLAGFVAGLWLDWLLRKFDGSRAEASENLGYEMMNLATEIRRDAPVDWQQFLPKLRSAFIKAKAFRVWAPDDEGINRVELGVLRRYLQEVGTMLKDGHFKEAKKIALDRRQVIEEQQSH
jgi:amino acid transporter